MDLLHVSCSPSSTSVSRKVADHLIEHLKTTNSELITVVDRDLVSDVLPQMSPDVLESLFSGLTDDKKSDVNKEISATSTKLIDELVKADTIVISMPVHNFGIPANLKSWIDLVTISGKTFKYSQVGPIGLLDNRKKVYLVIASGGVYTTDSTKQNDFVVPYMKHILKFMGLTDVTVIRAEGLARTDKKVVIENAVKSFN